MASGWLWTTGSKGKGWYKDGVYQNNDPYFDPTPNDSSDGPDPSTFGTDSDAAKAAAVEASDLASTTKLPDWAEESIQNKVDTYGDQAFGDYLGSIEALRGNTFKNNELNRNTSNQAFNRSLATTLRETSHDAGRTLAAKGQTSSSVGAEYMADLASSTYSDVLTQHKTANQGAATSDYNAIVNEASSYKDAGTLLGEYLDLTRSSKNLDTDMDFDATGSLNSLDSSGTFDSSKTYTADDLSRWKSMEKEGKLTISSSGAAGISGLGGGTYNYTIKIGDYKLNWNASTGKFTNVEQKQDDGTYKKVTDTSGIDTDTLNWEDLFSTTQLPEWGSDFVQNLTDTYGDKLWDKYSSAVNRVGEGQQWATSRQAKLDQQYGQLSDIAGAYLGAATRGATGTGIRSSALQDYTAGISEAQRRGRVSATASDTDWATTVKNQNLKDQITAYGGLSGLIGDYLGLTKYTYTPNYDKWLDSWKE